MDVESALDDVKALVAKLEALEALSGSYPIRNHAGITTAIAEQMDIISAELEKIDQEIKHD